MNPILLDTPEYIVEVWDINNVYVMDISDIIATSLRMDWRLNDIDEISFSIDLVQFEKRCAKIGARPLNILEPYRSDIKIRRNNDYIIGAHVVRTNVNFNSTDTNKVEVQCTGYLNHLKDRVMTAYYDNKTYAQIARQLITDTQASFNMMTDQGFRKGINGWEASGSAFIEWRQTDGDNDIGSLYTSMVGAATQYGGARKEMPLASGIVYTLIFHARAVTMGGNIYIGVAPAATYGTTAIADTNWHTYTVTWTQPVNSSYFEIMTSNFTDFWIDNITLNNNVDTAARRSFGITLGTDTATPVQQNDRTRDYDIQNVKDAIINLTKLEEDNFDFKFDANKVFYTYDRMGSDKPEIELVYPQNIRSIRTTRDAQTLANKVYAVGSGIGDERIQSQVIDADSSTTYRVRERVELFNSVELVSTLDENAYGKLIEYKDMYDDITVNLASDVIDINQVGLGDAIYVRIDDSTYVDYINGMYRIVEMSVDVSLEIEEQIQLTLRKWDVI